MKIKFLFLYLLLLLLAIPRVHVHGAGKPVPDSKWEGSSNNISWNVPQTYLYYADWLADSGDYYRAIGEYKKVLYFFPEYQKKPWIYLQIGRMYYMGGHYPLAIRFLTPLTDKKNDADLQLYARNWLGLSHYENRDYTVSYSIFNDLKKGSTNNEDSMDYSVYMALSLMNQKKFSEALNEFTEIKKKLRSTEYVKSSVYQSFVNKTYKDLKEINEKKAPSPGWAGALGVFPGGGYMYLKKWDYAFVSLTLIGLSTYLAYDGWVKPNMVQATIFSTLGITFYMGSIYSSYREATRIRSEWGNEVNQKAEHRVRELSFRIRHRY